MKLLKSTTKNTAVNAGDVTNNTGNYTMTKRVYLDHAATTPLDKRVLKVMEPYFSEKFGNAASTHFFGEEAEEAVEKAREDIAKAINAKPGEIYFTSGGTESDNLALAGIMRTGKKCEQLVTSNIEHHAIIRTADSLKKEGFETKFLSVNKKGFIQIEDVEKALKKKTRLVSVMHANNEIGTIQPIKEIGEACHKKETLFHSDAVQTVGKEKIDVEKMNIDMLSASAHKFYGPKGVGFLFKREEIKIEPLMFGGSHEKGLRPSTSNTPGIVGMAKALKIGIIEMDEENAREKKMRDRLVKESLEIKNSWINGGFPKIAGCAPLGFDFVEGQSMLLMLSDKGIAASTGSACNSEGLLPSHVLTALGLPRVKCHGSLRFTLGRENTDTDIDYVLEVLPPIVKKLREISPLRGK